ncbi:MAG: hypothetical protein H6744_00330 [Deltaproteobacteria bacterium]|nr:hypothetical protein [Deltaproteobacteria bacterium]
MRRTLLAIAMMAGLTAGACDDSTEGGDTIVQLDSGLDGLGDLGVDTAVPDTALDVPVTPDATADASDTPRSTKDVPARQDTATDVPATPDVTTDQGPTPDAAVDTTPTPDTAVDVTPTDVAVDTTPQPDVAVDTTPQPDVAVDTTPPPDTTVDVPPTPDTTVDVPPTPDTTVDVPPTPDAGTDTSVDEGPPPLGIPYLSHVTGLELLADDKEFHCDANADGKINADDGNINDLLGTLASFGVDANAEIAATVSEGTLILLLDLLGFDGMPTSTAVLDLLIGADIETQPDPTCGVGGKLEAACDWVTSDSSYDELGMPLVSVPVSAVGDGKLVAGPAKISFTIPLTDGLDLDLQIQNGRVLGDISGAFDVTNGRICGQVPKQSIKDALNASCAGPNAPSFCSFIGALDFILTCQQCSVVIAFESVEALSISPPAL